MAATRVAVPAGRVDAALLHGRGRWLESGESVRLGADGEARRLAFDGLPDAWTRGMLMADRMPLAEVLAELARYRRGLLRCDPQLARLAVSGAYPLLDLRRTLGMLQADLSAEGARGDRLLDQPGAGMTARPPSPWQPPPRVHPGRPSAVAPEQALPSTYRAPQKNNRLDLRPFSFSAGK